MHVLVDATNIINKPTGAGVYAESVLRELSLLKTRHTFTVLARKDLAVTHPLFSLPFTFVRVNYGTIGPKRDVLLSIYLWKNRKKFDAFFDFMPYLPPYSLTNSAITIHDLGFLRNPNLLRKRYFYYYYRLLLSLAGNKARNIVTVSEHTKSEVNALLQVPREKIFVAYNGPSVVRVEAEFGNMPPRPYILFVGERRPHKNLGRLVRAWAEFRKNAQADIALVLAGTDFDGCTGALMGIAKSLGVDAFLHIIDEPTNSELSGLYSGAFCLALVSLYEGFGIPLVDAMGHGTPIVASNRSAIPEVTGNAALLVEPESTDEIAAAFLSLWKNPSLKDALVVKGRERSMQFSWRTSAETICRIWDSYV